MTQERYAELRTDVERTKEQLALGLVPEDYLGEVIRYVDEMTDLLDALAFRSHPGRYLQFTSGTTEENGHEVGKSLRR